MTDREDHAADPRRAIDAAQEQATREGKRVAVIFRADWCGDSRAIDAALEHHLVAPIVDRGFVVVPVDVGRRDRHLDLMAEYGMDVYDGIPAVAILEPDGTLVAAQTEGEFRHARSMTILEIVTFFHRWAPPDSG